MSFVAYQIEKAPTTGQIHVQGMISFKNGSVRLACVKSLIGNEPHCEVCKDVEAHYKYVTKTESRVYGPWEHGERPKGQGKKKVSEQIIEGIKRGKSTLDLLDENPNLVLHDRAIKFARFVYSERDSNRQYMGKLNVIVSYGETGTGKTFSAVNVIARDKTYHKLSASCMKGGKIWFDGYEGQEVLILDDWDGGCCSHSYLKTLLDVYPLRVENKGGHAWAVWKTVVITSNSPPRDWFLRLDGHEDQTIVDPLKRRITEIRHYLETNIYQLEQWDGTPIGDQIQEPRIDLVRPGLPNRPPTPPSNVNGE